MELIKNVLYHLSKLDNIHQWEERDSIIKESVSQHSFKVAAICYFLLKDLEDGLKESGSMDVMDVEKEFIEFKTECLSYAILHDFDEAIIGRDISHVVKYNDFNGDKIRQELDAYVNHVELLGFQETLPVPTKPVKFFVKFCDWIALETFCKRNSLLGCKAFEGELVYCENRLKMCSADVISNILYKFGYDYTERINKIIQDI